VSHLFSNSLSRFARNVCEGAVDKLHRTPHRQTKRPIVEYYHLDNFAEIVDLALNPLDYENFEINNYIGFDSEVQTTILEGILVGNHPLAAARRAGVTPAKLEKWMSLGSQGVPPFAAFFTECLKASGEALHTQMANALGGGIASKAAIWWLGIMEPELYGAKEAQKSASISTNITQVNNFMSLRPEERYKQITATQVSSNTLKDMMRQEVLEQKDC
jgi:hypothetical protein